MLGHNVRTLSFGSARRLAVLPAGPKASVLPVHSFGSRVTDGAITITMFVRAAGLFPCSQQLRKSETVKVFCGVKRYEKERLQTMCARMASSLLFVCLFLAAMLFAWEGGGVTTR